MTPPPERPYSAERVLVITENSWTASTDGVNAIVVIETLFSGRTMEVPSILISLLASRPPLMEGVGDMPAPRPPGAMGITPGDRAARSKGLRPLSGKSAIRLFSITVARVELLVASGGGVPST